MLKIKRYVHKKKAILNHHQYHYNFYGHCAILLERRAVGEQDMPNLIIPVP
jgi:hypothetical protein